MRRLLTPLIATVLLVAGCGGHSKHHVSRFTNHEVTRVCSGLTDRCVTVPSRPASQLQSARGRIPDVSSFQGHPNWTAAKAAGIAGAIFKAGEYRQDPDAAYNAHQLASLHIWHALYWFVRNTGCSHEAAQIAAAAHSFGVKVVVNDLEVPEARGYGACLVPAERKAGLIAVDYTSPGSWPDGGGFGGASLWQAEYGPTLHPFWRPVLAWQCTDGQFGCVTFVPGIGVDDVSLNLGITKLGVAPKTKPTRLVCFGPRAQLGNATCKTVRSQVAGWSRARDASARVLSQATHTLEADRCVKPYRRGVCVHAGRARATMNQRERYFAGRVNATLRAYS